MSNKHRQSNCGRFARYGVFNLRNNSKLQSNGGRFARQNAYPLTHKMMRNAMVEQILANFQKFENISKVHTSTQVRSRYSSHKNIPENIPKHAKTAAALGTELGRLGRAENVKICKFLTQILQVRLKCLKTRQKLGA